MKKIILTLLLCLMGGNAIVFAQRDDQQKKHDFEKFKEAREAFITKEMKLTKEEADLFWPLANELQGKKFELNKPVRDMIRSLHKKQRDGESVSDAEYKKIIEASTQLKIKEAELDKEYHEKFLKVIPAEKVFKYSNADHKFGREMMDKREHRGDKPMVVNRE